MIFMADYIWNAWDSEGRYGSAGFTYNNMSTWERIMSEEIGNTGKFRSLPLSVCSTKDKPSRRCDPPVNESAALELYASKIDD